MKAKIIQDDLAAALTALRWSKGELADRLGVHRNTVSAWATGKVPLPMYAKAYLSLAVAISRLLK